MRPDLRLLAPLLAGALLLSACASSGDDECPDDGNAACAPVGATASPSQPSTPGPVASGSSSPAAASVDPSRVQVITTGLEAPWGLAFLPDGDALVSERDSKRILRVPAAGGRAEPVMTIDIARPRGEGGLLGIAVSPSYDKDRYVYAYVTTDSDNRVVRFRLGGRLEPVLTGIPRAAVHNGGRIVFGPDGLLYVGTGDAGDTSLAQDRRSFGGKILRLAPGDGPEVFSLGHRNVQGLSFDGRGRLLATEFGQNRFDEVNIVSKGDNGGWPEVEGRGGGDEFLQPLVTWRPEEASPSGAAVIGDDLWVAALRGQRLWRVPIDGSAESELEPVLVEDFGRLRAAVRAPDGALWVLTSNRDGRGDPVQADDRILRLPPT